MRWLQLVARKLRRTFGVKFLIAVFMITLFWAAQFSGVEARATVVDDPPTLPAAELATFGVAVNPSTDRVYVANGWFRALFVIDSSTNTLITSVPVGEVPFAVAVDQITNRVYVTNFGSNSLSVIDSATSDHITDIAVGESPAKVAVNPNTNRIYVANSHSNSVSVIGGSTNSVSSPIAVPEFPLGASTILMTALVFAISFTRKGQFEYCELSRLPFLD